eukprot:5010965-Prymnesium_polylepis.1
MVCPISARLCGCFALIRGCFAAVSRCFAAVSHASHTLFRVFRDRFAITSRGIHTHSQCETVTSTHCG